MKYINKFDNHSGYTEVKNGIPKPSVNYCAEERHIHYNDKEMVFTVNLNVTANTQNYFIFQFMDLEMCEAIRFDGEYLDMYAEIPTTVTAGEHVVEYVFPRMTVCPGMGYSSWSYGRYVTSVTIPEGIKRIESYPCQGEDNCFEPSIGSMYGAALSIPSTLEYIGVNAMCDDANISEDDMARLDSCCPEQGGHPWRAACGK